MVKKPADKATLSAEEGEALIARVHQSNLGAEDARIVEWVIRMYFWVALTLQEAKLSVRRLRNLFFGRGREAKGPPAPASSSPSSETLGEGAGGGEAAPGEEDAAGTLAVVCDEGTGASRSEAPPKATGGHRSGTGRLGADAYAGADRVECRHEELAVGQRCPVCGQGTLYELPPGVEIRIDGHALLSAMRYALQKLRCSACGQIFTAGLPEGVGREKYSARARAVLAVSRYFLGVPGYRLQGYQAMLGVPVADATQWDQIEMVGDCAYKVFAQMEQAAAQGELIFHDDTAVRILSLIKENRGMLAAAQAHGVSTPTERTGMHTTALAVKVGEHTAILYYSSRRHAGENLQGLLDKREAGRAKPLASACFVTVTNSSARDKTIFTGRPFVLRASAATMGSIRTPPLPPYPPPSGGTITRTFSCAISKISASTRRTVNGACAPLQTVSRSPSHCAIAACGSSDVCCAAGLVNVSSKISSACANPASISPWRSFACLKILSENFSCRTVAPGRIASRRSE